MNKEEEFEKIWKKVLYGLSVPARRVLLVALNQFVDPDFERFKQLLPGDMGDLMCGFKVELYSATFNVDEDRAITEIEQGCAELFDYETTFTQGGLFEMSHRDRLISHYAIVAGEKSYLMTLTPHLASRAKPLSMCLNLFEARDRVKAQRPPEEKPSFDAEEPDEPLPKSSPTWDRSAFQNKEFACEVSQYILTGFITYALTPQERPENAYPFPHLDPGLRRQLYQLLGGFINGVKSGEISL